MGFQNRSEFIKSQASEKITLVQIEATAPLLEWTLDSGSIYKRQTSYYAIGLKHIQTDLVEATSAAVVEGEFFYDPLTSTIYTHIPGGTDPSLDQMIVTYQFHYADAPITASHDLSNTGTHVHYEGRVKSSPGFKHSIGIDQKLTSVIGSGVLKLENTDGGLDNLFDTLFFENRKVRVYSWNRSLNFADAQIIYRGRVTNKTFTESQVEFRVKDSLFDLLQNVPQTAYTDADNVNDDIKGRYKRWIYGRVEGLQLQSIDQIGSGYDLTGTVAAGTVDGTLTGTGTVFLSETSPGDKITIGTQEFTIESVESDTSLTLDNTPGFAFTLQTATLNPEIPTTNKNRDFFVAGHATANLSTTVVSVIQLNRVQVADTTGFVAGDFVQFATGERIEIKNIDNVNDILVLQQNLILQPSASSAVVRQPVQQIFVEGDTVDSDNFTITNTPTETTINISSTVEFDLARTASFGFDATFTNGSRSVTTTDDIDLREILNPRDFIRPTDISFTTFYEILRVEEQEITLRVNFADPNHTGATQGKRPEYIGDNTIISADVLGRTKDNTSSGEWIQTAADAIKDLLTQINVTDINTASFTQAALDNSELISIALPLTPTGSTVQTKTVVDLLSKSVLGALTLDNDLDLQYRILQAELDANATQIRDEDLVSWSIKSTNNDTIRNSLVRYRHKDIDRFSLESGANAVNFSSDFVRDYIGTNRSNELDVYLFNVRSAEIASHRDVYYRSLSRADITIQTDLRLEGVEIGDQLILDFDRLFKRLGDPTSRKKVAIVVGKTVTGQQVTLQLSDLGNIYNRTANITDNAAPDFASTTEDERLTLGFITTSQGIISGDEDTLNTNLIN